MTNVIADGDHVYASAARVRVGDTLSAVALRVGLPTAVLARHNGFGPAAILRPGQRVAVPAGRVHRVRRGDTGFGVADAYGVHWARIVAANGLTSPFTLFAGGRLFVPDPGVVTPVPAAPRRALAAGPTIEQRAERFALAIDDVVDGSEPAGASPRAVRARPATAPRPSRPKPAVARPADVRARFAWPVDGPILSRFGAKPGGRFNDGVNIAAGAGSPVAAAAAGTVAYVGEAGGFGRLVLIRHADGWLSAYAHLESVSVTRGTKVGQGQGIGRVGSTGDVDRPQLHFEIRSSRRAIDPLGLLPPR